MSSIFFRIWARTPY